VGKKAENHRTSREKSKVVENQVFWLDFCAKEKDCAYTLRTRQDSNDFDVWVGIWWAYKIKKKKKS